MNFREYIEAAEKAAGGRTPLANAIGVHPDHLSNMKKGARPMPAKACAKMAEILDMDPGALMVIGEAFYAKNPEDQKFWAPFAQRAQSAIHAALMMLAWCAVGLVTLIVTPSPAEAHQLSSSAQSNLYYVKSRRRSWVSQTAAFVARGIRAARGIFAPPCHFAGC